MWQILYAMIAPNLETLISNPQKNKSTACTGALRAPAVAVFLENEELILEGKYPYALTEQGQYTAQIRDILDISRKNVYQSREVVEKEVIGYRIINTLLDTFCTAYNNKFEGKESNYDKLVLKMLPERFVTDKMNLYDRLLHICHFVSTLTDGKAVLLYNTITGAR